MLKLIMCVKRLPHLTRAEFDRHWREVHAPLVLRHQGVLGIKRYIQTVPLTDPAPQAALQAGRGSLPVAFDGYAELWWDSLDAHRAARATEEGARALAELVADEKLFVDLAASLLWYGTERMILP